jgi:hypothetical protein
LKNELENRDQFFKNKFKNFESEVDPKVWNAVQGSIGSGASVSGTFVAKSIVSKLLIGFAASAILTTGIFFLSTTNKQKSIVQPLGISVNNNAETIEEELLVLAEEKLTVEKIEKEKISVKSSKISPKEVLIEKPFVITPTNMDDTTEHIRAEVLIAEELEVVDEQKDANVSKTNIIVEVDQPKATSEQLVSVKEKRKVKEESLDSDWQEGYESFDDTKEVVPLIFKDKIPRFITPNGDGIADFLNVTGENIKDFHATIRSISNGIVVFEWYSIEEVWQGKDKSGNLVPKGTYMLVVVASGEGGELIQVQQSVTVY